MTTAPPDVAAADRGVRGSPTAVIPVLYASLAVLGLSAALGPTVPALLTLVAAAAVVATSSPRGGVIATVVVLLLLPTPFSVDIGPITASVGRVLLWLTVATSWLRRRDGHGSRLDLPMVLVLASLGLSMAVNLPGLAGFEVSGAIRKIALFAIDYFALFWVVVREFRSRASQLMLLRVYAGVTTGIAATATLEFFTSTNIFLRLGPILPSATAARVATAVAQSDDTLGRGLIRRVIGTLEQPLALGIVLAMALPIAVALAFIAADRGARLVWTFAVLQLSVGIIFTAARSIYVIAAITLVTMLLFSRDRRARVAIASVALLGGSMFIVQPAVRDTMVVFFQPQRGDRLEGSVGARTADYGPIARLVDDQPFFGYGPRTFAKDELVLSERVPDPRNLVLDNAYLVELVESGAIGLLALVLLLATAYCSTWRSVRSARTPEDRILRVALLCVIQAWIIMGVAADVYIFNAPPRVFFALLGVAALQRLPTSSPDHDEGHHDHDADPRPVPLPLAHRAAP